MACSSPAVAPDAPSGFSFTGDYTLEPNITSAAFGSAIYTGGQTIHVARTYASYAAAAGDHEVAAVTADGTTAALWIGPFCDPQFCTGTLYSDVETDTVEWAGSAGVWVQGDYSCASTSGVNCAGTVN
ncbi:MAG TPA: hypothetical protein VGG28_00105 [Kofleriaceae bacterium]